MRKIILFLSTFTFVFWPSFADAPEVFSGGHVVFPSQEMEKFNVAANYFQAKEQLQKFVSGRMEDFLSREIEVSGSRSLGVETVEYEIQNIEVQKTEIERINYQAQNHAPEKNYEQANSVSQNNSYNECVGLENNIFIPKLRICAPMSYNIPWDRESDYMGFLHNGAVHFEDTALPGDQGTVYVGGHSSKPYGWPTGSYDDIFSRLPELGVGNSIFIKMNGETFEYKSTRSVVVMPNETWVINQHVNQKLVAITTCYPVGTSEKRYVVIAEIV